LHTTATSYANNTTLTATSGTIDLTSFTSGLVLYLEIRYETEIDFDGFRVEYSDDDGTNWFDLGAFGEGINWYNDTDVDAIANDEDGWSGHNEIWQAAEINLPAVLSGDNNTKYRVTFQSNDEFIDIGVAFDNFMIYTGAPDLYVEGNEIEIFNGESTTSNLADTDFRNVDVTGGTKTNIFTISNRGGDTLNLTGGTPVAISGTNSADFTVTSQPGSTLSFVETSTFSITFDPSATGTRVATISIASDDTDDDPYTFAISGVGDNSIISYDFATADGWAVGTTTNGSWVNGNGILSTGADGDYWHTDVAVYQNSAAISVISPVIDLSGNINLALRMDVRYNTEADLDGMRVEYSIDGGTGWSDLGMYLDGLNWYNDTDVDGFADGEDGWSGDNSAWETAEIDLPAALAVNTARFRVLFGSNTTTTDIGVGFDNFAIYAGVTPLPVEMLSFDAVLLNESIQLSWSTSSELNNDLFNVQRSSDGNTFTTIGEVAGHGTINEVQFYQFVDHDPILGLNYYRLEQIDYDGTSEIHKTIRIDNSTSDPFFDAVIFPNPSFQNEELSVSILTMDRNAPVSIKLVDVLGKIHIHEINDNISKELISLKPSYPLTSGLYIISITQGSNRISKRIVIK